MHYVRCTDKFSNEILDGDFVDVQIDGVHKVYKKNDGQLYFKPYGKEERVAAYFSNDMVLCDQDGNWLIPSERKIWHLKMRIQVKNPSKY